MKTKHIIIFKFVPALLFNIGREFSEDGDVTKEDAERIAIETLVKTFPELEFVLKLLESFRNSEGDRISGDTIKDAIKSAFD